VRGVFLDLETNGLDPWIHVPVEAALRIIDLESGQRLDSFHSMIQCSAEQWLRSDPESLRINRLTWDELAQQPSAREVGDQLSTLFGREGVRRGEAVFICQNPSFDRAFFSRLIPVADQELQGLPYHWLDLASMYWARVIQDRKQGKTPRFSGFSKDRIAEALGLPPEQQPHRALNGVDHLIACYERLVGWPLKTEIV
jgi:oligoribonuclease